MHMHNIPKIIHQIWVGPNAIPEKIQNCINSVKYHFPDFEYIFWDNNTIPNMPSNVAEQYHKYGSLGINAFQADVLRLYVLNQYGGIFLDADFFVRQNFYHVIKKPFWCIITNTRTRTYVYNGLFACEAKNPILEKLLSEMKDEPLGGKGLQGHGPLLFSKYIRQFVGIPNNHSIYHYLLKNPHPYVQCDAQHNYENGKYTKHLFLGSSNTQSAWKKQL